MCIHEALCKLNKYLTKENQKLFQPIVPIGCNTRKNEIRAKNRSAVCLRLALGELGHYRFLVMHKNRSLHFTKSRFIFHILILFGFWNNLTIFNLQNVKCGNIKI